MMPLDRLVPVLTASLLAAAPAHAAPDVVTDIAPVHALVARVMDGVGAPEMLVQPGASPHDHAMRPSQARALQQADLVFHVGAGLTPWLDKALGSLSSEEAVVALADVPGVRQLPSRDLAVFAEGDDDHEDHDDHDEHEDHDGHQDDHEDHDADTDDDHQHAHGAVDPHLWLDPANALAWLGAIADSLSAHDPDNAAAYRANANTARDELDQLSAQIQTALAPVRDRPFIVYHDAYQYFEAAFDIPATGAVAVSDAQDPGAARIARIKAEVAEQGIVCVFTEPQFDPKLVQTVFDASGARIGIMDPLGAGLDPGPQLYPQMLTGLADALIECLSS
ncbi:zinc ABC transporter substrate-binding protein [Fluviibacterium sp. DFM31]|uniref:High-affinity zinc uptake system protein ZnuA n=1 Tax=Meridianimarinicoccus marinus TaxID=3231483 RepID=A0ABV3LC96_9RHOB